MEGNNVMVNYQKQRAATLNLAQVLNLWENLFNWHIQLIRVCNRKENV